MINFRRFSTWLEPLVEGAVRMNIKPDHLSYSGVVFAFLAGLFLAYGRFATATGLMVISGVMDALDGMVARKTNAVSPRGIALDSVLDRYSDFFVLAGLCVHYRFHKLMLMFSLAALFGSFMVSYSTAKADAIHVTPPVGGMRREERWFWLALACLCASFCNWLVYPDAASVKRFSPPVALAVAAIAVLANVSAIKRVAFVFRQTPRE